MLYRKFLTLKRKQRYVDYNMVISHHKLILNEKIGEFKSEGLLFGFNENGKPPITERHVIKTLFENWLKNNYN